MAKALMIQGTGSSVGKSVIVAGLCRLFLKAGYKVAPFKSQNMALNSGVTKDGREMGRAQVVQALAAGLEPDTCFNPILLKPKGDALCQVIVDGLPVADLPAATYHGDFRPQAWATVKRAYERLDKRYEVIVIEGAGSPAEVNLYDQDIVNMRVAHLADAPVILVADIDRGGALAAIVGTLELLEPPARERIRGLIINKFRGDAGLLAPALSFLEEKTGRKVAGVIPFQEDLALPEEDTLAESVLGQSESWDVDLAVLKWPHLSNFTDFDAFSFEPGVRVRYVGDPRELDGADAVILPGTKNTVADLAWLRNRGLADQLAAWGREGRPIIGVCGGFQMLGQRIEDPHRLEHGVTAVAGLGLMPLTTCFERAKLLRRVRGRFSQSSRPFPEVNQMEIEGYEIHHGRTKVARGPSSIETIVDIYGSDQPEGYCRRDKPIFGTYLHGFFDNDVPRWAFLNYLRDRKGLSRAPGVSQRFFLERCLDDWAATLASRIDLPFISRLLNLELPESRNGDHRGAKVGSWAAQDLWSSGRKHPAFQSSTGPEESR